MIRILLIAVILTTCYPAKAQKKRWRLPAELKEVSGIVYMPDRTVWAINDGGNAPVVYRFDLAQRKITTRISLPAVNRDWEDLQMDASGNLWIGDIGNNLNRRKDLRFYRFNPVNGQLDSVLFCYPDQKAFPPHTEADRNYDGEAFIWFNDTLHIFTKSRFAGRHFTKHYTVPAIPGNQPAFLVDSLYLPDRVVSGAAISNDGKTLALTAYMVRHGKLYQPYTRASVFYITGFTNSQFLKGKITSKRLPRFLFARQFESVSQVDKTHWMMANEGILWQKPSVVVMSYKL